MVNTNPHPLNRFRAIAAPSNMPEFAKAFGCKKATDGPAPCDSLPNLVSG
jgi:predicted metalloendopeptidase